MNLLFASLSGLEASGILAVAARLPEVEYAFRHALLHEAAYGSLVRADRQTLHRAAGEALEGLYPNRLDELAPTLARHFGEAADAERALKYFRLAAERAFHVSAFPEAAGYYEQALHWLPAGDDRAAERAGLLRGLGESLAATGDFGQARERYQASLALARQTGDARASADALSGLCWVAARQGALDDARRFGEEALVHAQECGDQGATALTLRRLGIVAAGQGRSEEAVRFWQQGLALYRQAGDVEGVAGCLNNLGIMAKRHGDYAAATRYYEEALTIARQAGDRRNVSKCLNNLGDMARARGDFEAARRYLGDALAASSEIGDREGTLLTRLTLGDVALARADPAAAEYYRSGLAEALRLGALPLALFALAGVAEVLAREGQLARAAELLGLIEAHPATDDQARGRARPAEALVKPRLSAEEWARARERGQALDLKTAASEVSSTSFVAALVQQVHTEDE